MPSYGEGQGSRNTKVMSILQILTTQKPKFTIEYKIKLNNIEVQNYILKYKLNYTSSTFSFTVRYNEIWLSNLDNSNFGLFLGLFEFCYIKIKFVIYLIYNV